MSQLDTLDVDVYKTTRRPETFLFVPAGVAFNEWPDGLAGGFRPGGHFPPGGACEGADTYPRDTTGREPRQSCDE